MKSSHSIKSIANSINAEIYGQDNLEVVGLCSLEEQKPQHLAFYKGSSALALNAFFKPNAANVFIISKKIEIENIPSGICLLKVENPHQSFVQLIPLFYKPTVTDFGIHPSAVIDETAEVSKNCQIGPFCYIGANSKIGEGTIIHPQVTIYNNVTIGKNCVIHSGAHIREEVILGNNIIIQNGACIGADGFGYITDPSKGIIAVPQIGTVTLADQVELGANSCIDRGALDPTRIGHCSKIDNLAQIGHNTQVGSYSIICGQAAIAGSVKIGNQVVLGGNVGVADHAEVSDGCRFAGFSGIIGKYPEKGDYAGNPAVPASQYHRQTASLKKLPKLFSKKND